MLCTLDCTMVEPERLAKRATRPRAFALGEDLCCKFHIKQDKDGGGHFDFHGVYEDEMIKTPEG